MLSRRYGLGLVRAHPFADATVTGSIQGAFTTAPATEYLVLVEGAIAGTASSDEALILAWDAAGADSIDVVTPVGGVWSTTITAEVEDVGNTTVYLIRLSTGQVLATLTVSVVWGDAETYLDCDYIHDARRGYTFSSGSLVASLTEQLHSKANDTASEGTPANQYTWTAEDSDFGGYPSIGDDSDSSEYLRSSGYEVIPQPFTLILVGRWVATGTQMYLFEAGQNNLFRVLNNSSETTYYVWAGSSYRSMAGFQNTQAEALYVRVNGAATSFEAYRADGTRIGPTVIGDPGSNSTRGIVWKNRYGGGQGVFGRKTIVAYKKGTLGDTSVFESYLQGVQGFSASP